MKLNKQYILLAAVAIFAILLTLTIHTVLTIDTKHIKEDIIVTISEGSGTKSIAYTLKTSGIIKSKFAFINYIKKNNATTKLKPGIYKFEAGDIDFQAILEKLLKGTVFEDSITVTIPEGYTVTQIADLLSKKGLIEKQAFLDYITSLKPPYDYIEDTGDYRKLEGFLFPETYSIPISWKNEEIVNALLNQFNKTWNDEYKKRAEELNLKTEDIITIASLIEREAKVDNERKTISSVIHNRIKKGMLLQIDATVQYLLPEQKGRLLYKDLEIDSPYNTYKYAGLPPTPIAAPGKSCIEAALYPEETQYYYYRAKSSGNGEHYFSKTFEEHTSYSGK